MKTVDYETIGAAMCADLGYEDPELMGGPFLNVLKKIGGRIKERVAARKAAGKGIDVSGFVDQASGATSSPGSPAAAGTSGLPSWAIPAGIGAAGLIGVLMLSKKKGR